MNPHPEIRINAEAFRGTIFDPKCQSKFDHHSEYDQDSEIGQLNNGDLINVCEAIYLQNPSAYHGRSLEEATPLPVRYNPDEDQHLTYAGRVWKAAVVGEASQARWIKPQGAAFGKYALRETVVVWEKTDQSRRVLVAEVISELIPGFVFGKKPEVIREVASATNTRVDEAISHAVNEWRSVAQSKMLKAHI